MYTITLGIKDNLLQSGEKLFEAITLTSLDDLDKEIANEYFEHPVALAFWQATSRRGCRQGARCSEKSEYFYEKDD